MRNQELIQSEIWYENSGIILWKVVVCLFDFVGVFFFFPALLHLGQVSTF